MLNVMKQLYILILYETKSLADNALYKKIRDDYESLSKQINTYIQWVSDNLNEYPSAKPWYIHFETDTFQFLQVGDRCFPAHKLCARQKIEMPCNL